MINAETNRDIPADSFLVPTVFRTVVPARVYRFALLEDTSVRDPFSPAQSIMSLFPSIRLRLEPGNHLVSRSKRARYGRDGRSYELRNV